MRTPPATLLMQCILLFMLAEHCAAEMRNQNKIRAGTPPHEILAAIIETNQHRNALHPQIPTSTASAGRPSITWLADADSRIQPQAILANPAGRIFAVHNLGNQLQRNLAEIDFGVRELWTPVLLITGSTGSDTIRSLLPADKPTRQIPHDVVTALEGLQRLTTEPGLPANITAPEHTLRTMVEKNIDHQVGEAVQRYRERVQTARLVVIGSVLDMTNLYGQGAGRLFIININGETEDSALRRHPVTVRLSPSLLAGFIGRNISPPIPKNIPPAANP